MDAIIEKLGLEPHPERGYYRETYRAPAEVQSQRHDGSRAASTAIYFFVTANEPMTFLHRLVSDEIFHLYDGGPLEIVRLFEDGRWDVAVLGMNLDEGERPQIVIPAGTWFGTELRVGASHCLVGCTVAPGFDFADFELAQGPELEARYPEAAERIRRMSRRSLVSGRHERGELRRAGAGWSRFGDTMNVSDAISTRRSIKRFTSRPVTREEIETLLSAAVAAPNHRLTQPWRFYVLGPEARQAYGLVLGERKARKIEDPDAARAIRDTVAAEHRALPAMLIVAAADNDNPEIKEEDYAAVMMAIQNLSLAAVALGLGTHVKTGAVMSDPGARAAARVKDNQRIVAVVNIGEPAEIPAEKKREPATAFTTWQP